MRERLKQIVNGVDSQSRFFSFAEQEERFISRRPPLGATMQPEDRETWARALLRFRAEKDEFFRTSRSSPVHGSGEDLHPLRYFDPDASLRFMARLQRYATPGAVMLATSKGTRQLFNRVGHFDLNIAGIPTCVNSYQSAERDDPNLFIPFKDATSGKESYGAARYLDLKVEHNDEYAVDFNYAYNPYCAYSEDYVCPLPPQENWLKVSVRAGEKKYHD